METIRVVYDTTLEYLDVEIATTDGTVLDAQPVAFSFDRATWYDAAWAGSPATTRTAQLLLGSTTSPPLPPRGTQTPVFARVTDNPEAPVMLAGTLLVR